jgi:hypothetical protein
MAENTEEVMLCAFVVVSLYRPRTVQDCVYCCAVFLKWECHAYIVYRPIVPHHDRVSRPQRVKVSASCQCIGWPKLSTGMDASS